MSSRRGRRAKPFCPSIVMEKRLNIKPKVYEFSEDVVDTETESEDDATASSVKDESLHHHQIGDYSRRTQPNQPECPSQTSALTVRAANRPAEYDSDDEYIVPRQQIRQPLLYRPPPPATGVPVAVALDQRPSRNDSWSTRMREKYGLDTSEFAFNPSESGRL